MKIDLKKYTDDELGALMNSISEELERREVDENIIEIRNKKLAGKYGVENIRVYYGKFYDEDRDNYSFVFVDGKKEYDFYYNMPPEVVLKDDEDWYQVMGEFIPDGFCEASENMYEYKGTTEEAIAQLKKYGIVNIIEKDWE